MRGRRGCWQGPTLSGLQAYAEFMGSPLSHRHMPVCLTAPSAESRAKNEVRAGPPVPPPGNDLGDTA